MSKKTVSHHKKFHLPAKEREFLVINLAALLKAGVPIGEAIGSLIESGGSRTFKTAMKTLQSDIDDGMPLWRALELAGIAGEQTIALIQFGEESGDMVKNMEVASAQEQKTRLFRSKVRSALIYPVFVLTLTIIIGLSIAWFLLPKLSDTFSRFGTDLPLISRLMIDTGKFLAVYGIYVVPGVIGAMLLIVYVLFIARRTRSVGNALLFHVPGIRTLLRQVETARFSYLFGTLLKSGLSVTRSVELLERSTGALRYRKFYRFLKGAYDDGYGLRDSFKKYHGSRTLFEPTVQQMIIAGERSGNLSETLAMLADNYEAKADVSTKNLEVIMEPVLLVFVWLGVLGVAISVILPIYQLVGNVGN